MLINNNINQLYCRNSECADFEEKSKGNIVIKEYKGINQYALFLCKTCGKCFGETKGTPFFGLKTSIDEVARVLSLIPKLDSFRAVGRYTNHKTDTIIKWVDLVRNDQDEINDYFHQYYHYTSIQLEDMWSSIENRKRK